MSARLPSALAAGLAAVALGACGSSDQPAAKQCEAPELPEVRARAKKHGAVSVDAAYAAIDRLADDISRDDDLAKRTPGVRAVFPALLLEAEVENGGHFQFFFNAGDFTDEALAGLRLLEAREYEQLLARAVAQFPGCDDPEDLDAVQAEIDAMSPEQEAAVEAVDDRFFEFELKKTLGQYAAEYIGAHRREFERRR